MSENVVTIFGIDILTISSAALIIATFGVVVRREFRDWLGAYKYQSLVLSAITAIIAYVSGVWELYIAAALTLVVKCLVIPRILNYATRNARIGYNNIEVRPYVSIRSAVIVSALFVALSYFLTQQFPVGSDPLVASFLPVSFALFLIGLFVTVIRRIALNQMVGLLIIENGLFLFTAVLGGTSILIEVGIFADILVGVVIAAILLSRMGSVIESMDIDRLTHLRDD